MKKLIYAIAALLAAGTGLWSCNDYDGPFGDTSVVPVIALDGFYSTSDPSSYYALEVDPDGATDTVFETGRVAKLKVYKPVVVPTPIDTFCLRVTTNARWTASTPAKSGFEIITRSGGGDTDALWRVTTNTSKTKDRENTALFYTNDSTTMCLMTIIQSHTVSE